MVRNKKVNAIIPVREGSSGIPGKNLLELGGLTLLERTILMAKRCDLVDNIIVSADSEKCMAIAAKHSVASREMRPADLATSTASTVDVILHESEVNDFKDDEFILLLQVTTPFRTTTDLNDFLTAFEAKDTATSSVSLTQHTAPHPDKIQKIENGFVKSYLGKESMVARQLLPEVYALNGAFYLAPLSHLKEKRSFFSEATLPFLIPFERSLNLDTPYDRYLMETLVDKGIVEPENLG